jgi:hypothetical protein
VKRVMVDSPTRRRFGTENSFSTKNRIDLNKTENGLVVARMQ